MHLGISEVEVTVLEPYVLGGVCRSCHLERERVFALAEHLDIVGVDLDQARCDLFIDGVLVTLNDLAAEGNGTLLVDIFEQLVIVDNYLQNSVFITDIEEHNAAVIADVLYPAGYLDLLSDIFFS